MEENLEKYKFYRFLKAFYYISLIFFCFIVILGASESFPKKVVDNENSFFTCSNGLSYIFSSVNISIYSSYPVNKLDYYDDKIAKNICSNSTGANDNYILTINSKVNGKWSDFLYFIFFGFSFVYLVLNIIRETVIYIFYGRKFTWDWAKVIFKYLSSH